jgi:hypothetical protein
VVFGVVAICGAMNNSNNRYRSGSAGGLGDEPLLAVMPAARLANHAAKRDGTRVLAVIYSQILNLHAGVVSLRSVVQAINVILQKQIGRMVSSRWRYGQVRWEELF